MEENGSYASVASTPIHTHDQDLNPGQRLEHKSHDQKYNTVLEGCTFRKHNANNKVRPTLPIQLLWGEIPLMSWLIFILQLMTQNKRGITWSFSHCSLRERAAFQYYTQDWHPIQYFVNQDIVTPQDVHILRKTMGRWTGVNLPARCNLPPNTHSVWLSLEYWDSHYVAFTRTDCNISKCKAKWHRPAES